MSRVLIPIRMPQRIPPGKLGLILVAAAAVPILVKEIAKRVKREEGEKKEEAPVAKASTSPKESGSAGRKAASKPRSKKTAKRTGVASRRTRKPSTGA